MTGILGAQGLVGGGAVDQVSVALDRKVGSMFVLGFFLGSMLNR